MEQQHNNLGQSKGLCFALMPFGGWFDKYWETIYIPTIERAGYTPNRADDFYQSSDIMSDIWKSVNESAILLADLTGRNANVFYELGMAHALSKPVILITSVADEIPFDLRAIRHLMYDKNDPNWGIKLKDDLYKALTTSDTKESVPTVFKRRYVPPKSFQVFKGTLVNAIADALNGLVNIDHLRIIAHSTSVIYSAMASYMQDSVKINRCDLILRKFINEDSQNNEQTYIRRAIAQWKVPNNRIENLNVLAYEGDLLEYHIIIDDQFLITGLYIKDSEEQSGIKYRQLLYLKRTDPANDMIKYYIDRFDRLKLSLKNYE